MISIGYKSSSGKTYNLVGDKMRVRSGSFHTYKWNPKTKERKYGEKVQGFYKDAAQYELTLTFRGSLEERKKQLNDIHESFERDIINEKPGTIYYGDYHIEAYVISSDTGVSDDKTCWSDCDVALYCPYPFWTKEITNRYGGATNKILSDYGLDYDYDYKYDYASSLINQKIIIEGEIPASFKMIIYGSCENPTISIGTLTFKVNTSIGTGEYIVIDSIQKTITKVANSGEKINIFNERDRESDFFEKIPAGTHSVAWSGGFGFDIIAVIERSEPEWK